MRIPRDTRTMRRIAFSLSAVLMAGLMLTARPAAAQIDQLCFEQTGFCIQGRIRDFWSAGGGLTTFGYPIGSQQDMSIEGRTVTAQWFERARLELHPENVPPFDVLLGRLGAERLGEQGRDWTQFPRSAPQAGCRFFPETGHNVCGAILAAWRSRGVSLYGLPGVDPSESLGLFGLPLSGVQTETLSDGRAYRVQWFERARLELHPENASPYNVLGGLLGRETLDAQEQPAPTPAAPEPPPSRVCTVTPRGQRSVQRAGVQISAASFHYHDAVAGVQSSADDDFLKLTVSVVNVLYRQSDGSPGRIFANVNSFQLVDSQGRAYSPDVVTGSVGDRFVSGQVRPSETRTGVLVFRIPKDAVPQQLVYDGRALNANYPKIRLDLRWPGC